MSTAATPDHPESPEQALARLARLADFVFDGTQTGTQSATLAAAARIKMLALDLSDPSQRQLGNYQLLSKLGQGGMGVVFRAREPKLDRDVALKLLAAGSWASPEFVARFRAEAQLAARLNHPNIVPIFEIDQVDDLLFFTMALVDGQTLNAKIKARVRFTELDAAKLVRTAAEAIDYAHRLGVLHLDLKPANILIDARGEPQIADFGLSRRLGMELAASDEVSGTPNFMAPEQIEPARGALSAATDIYGLGGVLHQMLTWAPLFLADSTSALMQKVLHESAPDVRAANPGTSADMAAICAKCLQKNPDDRYVTARELADDLQRLLERRPVSVRPLGRFGRLKRWVSREPKLAIAAGTTFIALSLGLAAAAYQANVASDAAHKAAEEAENARVVAGFLTDIFTSASPAQHRGHVLNAVELLDLARQRIDPAFNRKPDAGVKVGAVEVDEFADRPALRAQLLTVIASSYYGQSRFQDCIVLAEQALAIQTLGLSQHPVALLPGARVTRGNTQKILNDCYFQVSRLPEVVILANQAVANLDGVTGALETQFALLQQRGMAQRILGDRSAAEATFRDILQRGQHSGRTLKVVAETRISLARLLEQTGQLDEALSLMRRGIDDLSTIDGADAPAVLSAQAFYGLMLAQAGKTKEGLAAIDYSYDNLLRVVGPDAMALALTQSTRADVRQMLGDLTGALSDYQGALMASEKSSGNSRNTLNYSLSVAETLVKLERFAQAATAYIDAQRRLLKTNGLTPAHLSDLRDDIQVGLCATDKRDPRRGVQWRTPPNLVGCEAYADPKYWVEGTAAR
jgi:eukaryotic-like serine/threonine-protein kinase